MTNNRLNNEQIAKAISEIQGLISLFSIGKNEKTLRHLSFTVKGLRELQECRNDEREKIRIAHAKWSRDTFGNVGPVGPLKHLSKEALEAAAEPSDLSEWADMQFLLWDAQCRAGINDEQITRAMIDKLEVNKAREWPEPKDGEPRHHVKRGTDSQD